MFENWPIVGKELSVEEKKEKLQEKIAKLEEKLENLYPSAHGSGQISVTDRQDYNEKERKLAELKQELEGLN
jgi:DNA repair exonuclease SbcCD ATPase subunit